MTNASKPNNNNKDGLYGNSYPTIPKVVKDVLKGLSAGLVTSLAFAPYDRAMFLAISENRVFLSALNFSNPYHGFQQVVVSRSISTGMYYIMQGTLNDYCYPYLRDQLHLSESATQFVIGSAAGCISGIITNPLAAIKFYTWLDTKRNFKSSVSCLASAGIKPFMRGIGASAMRDTFYGCIYEVLRHKSSNHVSQDNFPTAPPGFIPNSIAAGVATIVTSPINYARNVQYATPPAQPTPSMIAIWKALRNEAKNYPSKCQLQFFSRKLQLGPGISRVAIGAGVAQLVYDSSGTVFNNCADFTSESSGSKTARD